MSLLPTERLVVALTPTQASVAHAASGWRRRDSNPVLIDAAPHEAATPAWHGALDGLAGWLADRKPRRATAALVLADSFVRFALVPWSEVAASPEEETELALACFESRYGDMTGWSARLDSGRYNEPRIACAVETALLEAARQTFARHGLACATVRPAVVVAWNCFRRELDRAMGSADGLFALAESGTVVMITRRAGAWHSLRSVASSGVQDLPESIEREALLQGFAAPLPAWVVVPGRTRSDIEAAPGWNKRLHVVGAAGERLAAAVALARWGARR